MRLTLNTFLAVGILTTLFSCTEKRVAPAEDGEIGSDGMRWAWQQEFYMTRDPKLGVVPKGRLFLARQLMQGIARTEQVQALTWQERGPNNIAGRTRAIVVDRRDATGNTVLAASVSGGIFKTTNFLSNPPTWTPVDDKMNNLAVSAMKQDPNNPAVIYAGTGEGWANVDAVKGAGIFKSTDGGNTWNLIPSTATFEFVQDIEIDKNGNLYASLRNQETTDKRGVWRSTNGGGSWTQVLGMPLPGFTTGRAADLEVASNGDVYATLGILTPTMVMKSSFSLHTTNTGAVGTWDEITPVHSTPTERGELAVAPSNPNRLYLLMQNKDDAQVKTIYRSNNAGVTWDSLPAPAALNNEAASQTWYNLIAQVDPNNPDMLWVGGLHLARSGDGGSNWVNLASSTTGVHVDQHELVFFGSDKLYVGNDGGVYFSGNPAAGTPTFANKNNSYNVTQFYSVDHHPTNTNYFLGGTQDNNTQKFTAPGINTTTGVGGGDGGFAHIDQTDNGVIQVISAYRNRYYRSNNNGASFSYQSAVSNDRGRFINPTDYDDTRNVLYCGDDAGKYYVITGWDASTSGTVVDITSAIGGREVTAVKVHPGATNTVWLGAYGGRAKPMIVKLANATSTAPLVLASSSLDVPVDNVSPYISSIDVDPNNGAHIVATLSNYGVPSVWESTDGGGSWVNVEGNLPDMPIRWALILPSNASVNGTTGGGIVLGTELGVWYTAKTSGSSTQWTPENTNFPNVRVDMLKYRPSDNLLVAATHGRGLFTTNLTSISTGVPSVPNTKNFIEYASASQQELFIKVGNLTTTRMQVRIYDLNGRLVNSTDTRYADQRINLGRLSRGSYILKIFGNRQEQYTKQFVR